MISGLKIIPEALVFDCGGTLLELNIPRENTFQEVLADEGLHVELELIRRAYDIVDWSFKQRSSKETTLDAKKRFFDNFNIALCDVLGLRSHALTLNEHLQDAFKRRCNWQADDDTKEWLFWASKRFECYVLANWSRSLNQVLDRAGIAHFFRGIYCSEELGAEKPDPKSFEVFLNATNLRDKPRMYNGNEYIADVIGSRSFGFEPVLFDQHGRYPPVADCFRISDWNQLRKYLTND